MIRRDMGRASTRQSDEYELITTDWDTDVLTLRESTLQPDEESEDVPLAEAALYSEDQIVWLRRDVNNPVHFDQTDPPVKEPHENQAETTAPGPKHESMALLEDSDNAQRFDSQDLPNKDPREDGGTAGVSQSDSCPSARNTASKRNVTDFTDHCIELLGWSFLAAHAYLNAHNPLTRAGRLRLKNTILRSGLPYQLPSTQSHAADTQGRFTGWRMGTLLSCVLLVLCFVLECGLLIAALINRKTPLQEVYNGVLYEGSCDVTQRWTTLTSLILNFIATMTIGSSNYVMQCLSSPSEDELRRAHKNGRSLQIGVSSPSNIVFVHWKKTILWCLLGISSIPVHLLLNSAFFSATQTNNYAIAVVASNYNQSSHWSYCTEDNSNYNVANWNSLACSVIADAEREGNYERLEIRDCITRYARQFLSQYSNVILVSDASTVKPGDRPEYDIYPSFYNYRSWNNTGNEGGFSFEPEKLNLTALFGIFDAMDYQAWRSYINASSTPSMRPDHNFYFNPARATNSGYNPFSWICHWHASMPCTKDAALQEVSNWNVTLSDIPISHCLSKPTPGEFCRFQYSSLILGVVIGCDVVKICVVVLALTSIKSIPLVTIGDVLATLLKNPERYTVGRCLVDQDRAIEESEFFWCLPLDFERVVGTGTVADIWPEIFGPLPRTWTVPRKRWYNVPSTFRWFCFLSVLLGLLGAAGFTLSRGLIEVLGLVEVRDNPWTVGFMSANPNAIFPSTAFLNKDPDTSFMVQVLLVNTPQLVLSMLYFYFNGIFTCMHAAEEFSGFATERKPLRVSQPEPGQRSTYWLSLPWTYSLPLIALQTTLHWLVSRGIYLVNIEAVGPDGRRQRFQDIIAIGFSNLMVLMFIVLMLCMLVFLATCSVRRLDAAIPLIGTASVAISAVCHHPNDPKTEAFKPLLWGVTKKPGDGKPGHCSLSSDPVEVPVEGEVYS